ncbi:hypothetical protein [Vibrio sp. HN007]|uniref:hypothetical protein n=1 Tax=Vibrio iocasae TaxID=3098914 RepID=UPI0035D43F13
MDIIKLNLEIMSEQEARDRLREFGYELPDGFDFRQHTSLSFDTQTNQVIEVEKRFCSSMDEDESLQSAVNDSNDE